MERPHVVDIATYIVAKKPARLTCLSLGSCVGVALYDRRAGMGGLAHPMLPLFADGKNRKNPARYVDTSIYLMLDELVDTGGDRRNIRAKIVGGAEMFGFSGPDNMRIGDRNVKTAEQTLTREGIFIKAKETGGSRGRTVVFDVNTGAVRVRKIGGMESEI